MWPALPSRSDSQSHRFGQPFRMKGCDPYYLVNRPHTIVYVLRWLRMLYMDYTNSRLQIYLLGKDYNFGLPKVSKLTPESTWQYDFKC
jgi:hypothetical protein